VKSFFQQLIFKF